MIFRRSAGADARAAQLRDWMRRPPASCPLCIESERADPSALDEPDAERIFRCAQCGRLARPLPTDRSEL
jgi:hypothetical protein